jgi:hypothetical protein
MTQEVVARIDPKRRVSAHFANLPICQSSPPVLEDKGRPSSRFGPHLAVSREAMLEHQPEALATVRASFRVQTVRKTGSPRVSNSGEDRILIH